VSRCLVGLVNLFWCSHAYAHEIGKSQATVLLRDGRFQADVVVDPDALLSKLEVFGGRSLSREISRADRDARIRALAEVFAQQTVIRFDRQPVRAHVEYLPASTFNDLAQAPSVVRLSGQLPPGAREFDFQYGLALGTYALNVRIGDGPVQTRWIIGGATSEPFSLSSPPASSTRVEVAWQYLVLGFTHIVPHGPDHMLFVLGIFLLSRRWRSVLAQVSTFTVAHSITLALTMYGVVSLPAKVVEPMIALSIAYVAIENLIVTDSKPWRLALVFSFGLLHGMGFAGVLRDLGLPRPQFLTALISFNAGVEAGQLSVIAVAFAALLCWRYTRARRSARAVDDRSENADIYPVRSRLNVSRAARDARETGSSRGSSVRSGQAEYDAAYHRFVVQPASVLIALVGLFWTVQRVLS
jgi:hydrogenase/urease accessory protein HupE